MPLDSSDAFSIAQGGTIHTVPAADAIGAEVETCLSRPFSVPVTTWSYLFLHHTRVTRVVDHISRRFPTFVHKSIYYTKLRKRVVEVEKETISGLLFIQGDPLAVSRYLHERFEHLYLAHNCATGQIAVIPDSQMQPFMRLAGLDPLRIRFMPRSIGHYADGHPLVRVVGGVLHGLEGYVVRIARDRRLVISVGSMTAAIGGVNKETFENVTDYVHSMQSGQSLPSSGTDPDEQAVRQTLFRPGSELDHLALMRVVSDWLNRLSSENGPVPPEHRVRQCLYLLSALAEISANGAGPSGRLHPEAELTAGIKQVADCLQTLLEHPALTAETRADTEAGFRALRLTSPLLAEPLSEASVAGVKSMST